MPGGYGDSTAVDDVAGIGVVFGNQTAYVGIRVVDHAVLPGAAGVGDEDGDGIRQNSIWADEYKRKKFTVFSPQSTVRISG